MVTGDWRRPVTRFSSSQTAFLHTAFCALSWRMQPPRIRFRPVELKVRHDGWTAARQVHFIEVLAATRSIAAACGAVGMSRTSAYKLRGHPEARSFRFAWSAALRPDFDRPRRLSPRTTLRLARLRQNGPAKVDRVEEMEGPPTSLTAVKQRSTALDTLQTYLAQLRAAEDCHPGLDPGPAFLHRSGEEQADPGSRPR